ncbi:MAG: Abi family protein [Bacilli bacterium]|nr:Abi family protein [Bacilli bacterium]
MKEFKTVKEQINILKSRGLIIDNETEVSKILEVENYYNLINGYKELFIEKDNDLNEKFIENTDFNEIYVLYLYDRNLRNIFMKYVLNIENYLKTRIVYEFSSHYGHTDYLKQENFNNVDKYKIEAIDKLINDINLDIENQKLNGKDMLVHYSNNHKYIPLWVLSIIITFGKLSKFYQLMKNKQQCAISKNYNLNPYVIITYMKSLTIVRNLCAHAERLYNIRLKSKIHDDDIHKKLNLMKNASGNFVQGNNDLFSIVIILKKLLSKEEFEIFFRELTIETDIIISKIDKSDSKQLLKAMGFPKNYKDILNY